MEAHRGLWGLSESQLCQQTDRGNRIGGACSARSETAEELRSPSGSSDASGGGDRDCPDFSKQEDAQQVLEQDPSDPNGLDVESDEFACERQPRIPVSRAKLHTSGV